MNTASIHRFNDQERHCLLGERGIGETVVARLEGVGLTSMAQLRQVGAAHAVLMVCTSVGSVAWTNRRRSLERALLRSLTQGPLHGAALEPSENKAEATP